MSKKLIAVVAAAALALTGLVATPANATTITSVKINKDNSAAQGGTETVSHAGTTSVSPVTYASSRTWDWADTGSTTRNVVRFDVTTSSATTVTVSSTGAVKVSSAIADADGNAYKVTDGSQSIALTTTASNLVATFYALNTSTTAGKVNISTAGSLNTYNVKGLVGTAYNLVDVKFPTSITSGNAEADGAVISFQVTDAYGNKLDTANLAAVTTSALGATVSAETYSTVRKQYEALVFGTASANVAMTVALDATDLSANGFAKPVKYAFSSSSAGSLADQVTALTAQVASLKTDYNKLAARWNKLVASKKAPKKTVATK
jgi:hypothetical protein